MPPDRPIFSRSEVLGGMPARRASATLFAIEAQTARLVAASRINRATYLGERSTADREAAFLTALAAGRDLPRPPRIQDLERYAPEWAALVPDDPDLRASLARMLGAKYPLSRERIAAVRGALGLDDATVSSAYERLHGQPIASIYRVRIGVRERLRWRRASISERIENMPAFWIAYALSLTETIGEGILIVPIAVAGLGPIPGAIALLVLGLVNLATLAGVVEAVTRNGSMRYGAAYFGRLVRELLGAAASHTLSIALALFNVVVFLAYLLGFASVIAGATGVPEAVWVAVLFAINVFFLRNESLDDTITSAVAIGAINVALIVVILAIAAPHVDPAHLAYSDVPLLNGRAPDGAIVGLVFGVILVAFFGHTSAANASKLVLTMDPSGRALLWGNLAALATVMGLYCAAVVVINGVVGPEPLLLTKGTSITPLADVVGPIVNVLGSIYVVLALGIGSLYVSLGLFNQVIELLPSRTSPGTDWRSRIARERRWRLAVGLAPAAAVFVVLELLLATDNDWFAGPVGIIGVLAVPLVGGVFPMLMVVAARRKGEYVPGRVLRIIGHPVVVVVVCALFLIGVVAHALVIWDAPIERAAALAVAIFTVIVIAWIIRAGQLRTRAVVEVRHEAVRRRTVLSVTVGGSTVSRDEVLPAGPSARPPDPITVEVPAGTADDLRIWCHAVSADGWSALQPFRATASVDGPAAPRDLVIDTDEPVPTPAGTEWIQVAVQLGEGT